jgi:hypothetical protein
MQDKSVYCVLFFIIISTCPASAVQISRMFVTVGIDNIAYQPHFLELIGSDAFKLRMRCSKLCVTKTTCNGFNWLRKGDAGFSCQLFALGPTTLINARTEQFAKVYLKLQDRFDNGREVPDEFPPTVLS